MKRKLFCLLGFLLLLSGCGKIPTLKNGEEAVVTFENGKMISVDELYEEIKDNYALSALVKMIDTEVLETEFKDYKKTAEEYADSYLEAIKESYDNEEDLLNDIQAYTGYSSLDAYKESLYLNYMQTHATEEYAKTLITDKEIEKYYKDEVVGDIEVSHILITPDVKDDMTEDEKKEKENAAYEKAQDILKTLKDTDKNKLSDTFASLAKENSMDEATAKNGGSLGKINKNTLSSQYDELVKSAYEIKDGEFYKGVITTELGYHVILRTKSYDKAELKDAKKDIISELVKQKIASDSSINITALQYYRKNQGVKIQDSELQTQYAYYIQNALAQSKTK